MPARPPGEATGSMEPPLEKECRAAETGQSSSLGGLGSRSSICTSFLGQRQLDAAATDRKGDAEANGFSSEEPLVGRGRAITSSSRDVARGNAPDHLARRAEARKNVSQESAAVCGSGH